MVLHRRVVVGWEIGAIPRLGAPNIGLGGRPRGDLVIGRQGRELNLQHAACCSRGYVLECDCRVDGVVGWATLSVECEPLTGRGIVAGRGTENINNRWTLG